MDEGDALDVSAALELPATPLSARKARAFITDICEAAKMPSDVCHTAALLVSELVTNAVLHARTAATIEVHRPADSLRVTVRDQDPKMPDVGRNPELGDEGGRGMRLVAMLADDWGVEAVDGGKAVWFVLGSGRMGAAADEH